MTAPCPNGCQALVDHLSAEVLRQQIVIKVLGEIVAGLHDELDRLSHEHAVDCGAAMVAEAEQFLADQEGGAS